MYLSVTAKVLLQRLRCWLTCMAAHVLLTQAYLTKIHLYCLYTHTHVTYSNYMYVHAQLFEPTDWILWYAQSELFSSHSHAS